MKTSFIFLGTLFITLVACGQNKVKIKYEKPLSENELSKYSQATFAAGCFWHEEAMFESIKGVKEAVSGYAGGNSAHPTYESIETGQTGHAETVNVYYDPSVIDFSTLLKIYFSGQNPTQVNGQGNDKGTQYRSIAFYRNANEKKIIEEYIKDLQPKFKSKIAAQVLPLNKFWTAESYHQNYIQKNPSQGYVQAVSIPEIKKVQKEYPQLIKPGYSY
jgi:peptide-methionine (S)-S-oxide reductase